jgi:hypothetical protein
MVARAFINTSNSSMKGSSQKLKTFQDDMHQKYLLLIEERLVIDENEFFQIPLANHGVFEPTEYIPQSPESIIH